MARPIYLHFLDNELRKSVGATADPDLLAKVLWHLLVLTTDRLYCGLSLLWESPNITSKTLPVVEQLIKTRDLEVVSHHPTLPEFIESRKELYFHAKSSYPKYFDWRQKASGLSPTRHKSLGTTASLHSNLSDLLEEPTPELSAITAPLQNALLRRGSKAVTYELFAKDIDQAKESHKYGLRRQISKMYTSHYLDYMGGDIVTGLPKYNFYDDLGRSYPYLDFNVLRTLLTQLAPSHGTYKATSADFEYIAGVRQSQLHQLISNGVQGLIREAVEYHTILSPKAPTADAIIELLRKKISRKQLKPLANIRNIHNILADNLNSVEVFDYVGTKETILIVTVTDVEKEEVIREFGEPQFRVVNNNMIGDLPPIGCSRLLFLQTEMGSHGASGSTLAIHEAITELNPSMVVMVGIAFGVDRTKQVVGDVLISKKIQAYESQRISSYEDNIKIEPRHEVFPTPPRPFSWFRAIAKSKFFKVHVGTLLSGEKLIDNLDYRNSLVATAPDIIGGEMEGSGLAAAAARTKCDWIVVKAICDWADGNKKADKKERQQIAARNAAQLVKRILDQALAT